MKQIRRGVFETNSSSTHSLAMCSGEEYDNWKAGKNLYCQDAWGSESEYTKLDWVTYDQARDILAKSKYYKGIDPFKLSNEELEEQLKNSDMQVYSFENYGRDMEFFDDEYTTPNGERVVAFGEFGYDG